MDTVEQTPESSRVEYCSVCADQADGYHYGVLSCRGCNAFFRRAITFNLQFQCRRAGNCVINRKARCACRACRLEKCKTVGMDRNAVQISHDKIGHKLNVKQLDCGRRTRAVRRCASGFLKRFTNHNAKTSESANSISIGIKNKLTRNIEIATASPPSCSQKSSPYSLKDYGTINVERAGSEENRRSTSSNGALPSYFTFKQSLNEKSITINCPLYIFGSSATIAAMPFTFLSRIFSCQPKDQPTDFFTKLTEEYLDQRCRRRSMLCATLEDVLSENTEELRQEMPASVDDLNAIYQVQMILMFEWVEKLTEFHQLTTPYDKVRLLRAFSMKYLLLDNVVYTLELGHLDRLVLINNSYVQRGVLPTRLRNCKSSDEYHALSLLYGENASRVVEELVKPMAEMNITFAEFNVLRLLLLWNSGDVGLTPHAEELTQRASEQALQELHYYLESNKSFDLKNRLSSLLLFLSPLTKHAQNLAELTSLIPDFGVLPEWDSFMNDLLRN